MLSELFHGVMEIFSIAEKIYNLRKYFTVYNEHNLHFNFITNYKLNLMSLRTETSYVIDHGIDNATFGLGNAPYMYIYM
jgi:hypothetical protein